MAPVAPAALGALWALPEAAEIDHQFVPGDRFLLAGVRRQVDTILITAIQRRLLDALCGVSFVPGTGAKRIVREACAREEMSDRMEACLWRIAYTFRRQLPHDVAEEAVRRKVDHRLTSKDANGSWICETCGRQIAERHRNFPCPGPPEPKKLSEARRTKSTARYQREKADSPNVSVDGRSSNQTPPSQRQEEMF